MGRIKYLTAEETEKRAKYKLACIGSCFAPARKVYGTITENTYGNRYNTKDVSIMTFTDEFWDYWEQRAKRENVFFELYADKNL